MKYKHNMSQRCNLIIFVLNFLQTFQILQVLDVLCVFSGNIDQPDVTLQRDFRA